MMLLQQGRWFLVALFQYQLLRHHHPEEFVELGHHRHQRHQTNNPYMMLSFVVNDSSEQHKGKYVTYEFYLNSSSNMVDSRETIKSR
jgi:hypothetical protein